MQMSRAQEIKEAPDTAPPVLTVNNIEVIYDHVILVLKGVSLVVPEAGSSPCSALTVPARQRR
jgi:branched-chain amino acid transport system ATP-binding protein